MTAPPLLFVSFPCSGRTWLRHMLHDVGIAAEYTHDGADHKAGRPLSALNPDKSAYRDRRILLMLRDPRDTAVSGWYHVKGRHRRNPGPLSDFIRNEGHGIAKIVAFNLQWIEAAEALPCCRVITYEGLQIAPAARLRDCAVYAGNALSIERAQAAAANRSFASMQEQERRGELLRKNGQPVMTTDPSDLSKYKVRRGIVGGYRDEFSGGDIAWSDDLLRATGYQSRVVSALQKLGVPRSGAVPDTWLGEDDD